MVSGDNPVYLGNMSDVDWRWVNWTVVFNRAGTFNLCVDASGKYSGSTPIRTQRYVAVTVFPREEHDLAVWVDGPIKWINPGKLQALNTTVYNVGMNSETNVELMTLANDTIVVSTVVPELLAGHSETLSCAWMPTSHGLYNITGFVQSVSGENIAANNMNSTFVEAVSLPDILVVADNDASSSAGKGTSLPEFESALIAGGFSYFLWNESAAGDPPLSVLLDFKLVIWTCGDHWNWAVDPLDAETLEAYIDSGGTLLLEGEDVGYSHRKSRDGLFMTKVAHAIYGQDSVSCSGLTVTDSDHSVTTGLPEDFSWTTLPSYPDGVDPTNGGVAVMNYSGTSWTAVTVFDGTETGNGSSVYLAFPLYCLPDLERNTLVKNSVGWLLTLAHAQTHDIQILNVNVSKTVVGCGYPVDLNVTLQNRGSFAEIFNVTAECNGTCFNRQLVTLAAGSITMITFCWNTTGFACGNYTVCACAEPVPGENDTTDNNVTLGLVRIAIVGDITGSTLWPDDQVDMRDLGYVARQFGTDPSNPTWNPNTDVNGDGKVDMRDVALVAKHFGEHSP